MPVRRWFAPLLGLLSLCATTAAAAQSDEQAAAPATTVTTLYTHHFAHDMAFTPAGISERSAWLAPDLVASCRAYFAKPTPPDEVPEINGDPFTDSQEYPTAFRVGQAELHGDRAVVPVVLSWPGGTTRTVKVGVARIGDAWLVSDVAYESGPSFRKLLAEGR